MTHRAQRRPAALRRRLRLLAGCSLPAAALLLSACNTGPPPPISAQELASAESFPYFPIYWVGRRFRTHPVTAVSGRVGYSEKTGESVYYGGCKPKSSLLGAGICQLPLQITTIVYAPHANGALGAQRNILLRGVPATISSEGRTINLYTGHLQIEVKAQTAGQATRAAILLRPLNAAGNPGETLPLPTYCPSLLGYRSHALRRTLLNLPDRACQISHLTEESP